jgi:hypothetical protein
MMHSRVLGRGAEGEGGAVAVETALVALLLVTMLFGIVEVSFLLRDGMVVSASSRTGARMASSMPRDPGYVAATRSQVEGALTGLDVSRVEKVWVYRADASGLPDSGGFGACTACAKFRGSGGSLVPDGGAGWAAADQHACSGSEDQVGVYIEYRYPSRLGFLLAGSTVSETTVMRLEPFTGSGGCQP